MAVIGGKGAVMGMNGSDREKGSSDGDEWQ